MSWRLTNSGIAWLSFSFWRAMVRESLVYLLMGIKVNSGVLNAYRKRPIPSLKLLYLFFLSALWCLVFYAILRSTQVRLHPWLLLRRRPGWQYSTAVGLLIALLIDAEVEAFAAAWEKWDLVLIFILFVPLVILWFISSLLLRNAAVQCQALAVLLMCARSGSHKGEGGSAAEWLAAAIVYLPLSLSFIFAGTAQTARDTRATVRLLWFSASALLAGQVVSNPSDREYAWELLLFGQCVGFFGHAAKLYIVRGRDVSDWADSIAFIKLSEITRRRKSETGFILARRQDMDPEIFGDAARAKHMIVVSHAWLSPEHADPQGYHLDLIISRLEEQCEATYASAVFSVFWRRWWRYYYLRSEGDVLLFYDFSSLYQSPRSAPEEKAFKKALSLMNFLYHSFDVLVITEIPQEVRHHGFYLSYMEKGWCWAEASIAGIGGRLHRFSEEVLHELDGEKRRRNDHSLSLSEALFGLERYPPELMQRGQERQLQEFRQRQILPGKVFTNVRYDCDRVAKILVAMERKQMLRGHLLDGETASAIEIFKDEAFFTEDQSGLSREDLANTAFDGHFTTPLHLAVASGDVELVTFLVSVGARPRRNFTGCLPWERFPLLPSFSPAATAARTELACAVHRVTGGGIELMGGA